MDTFKLSMTEENKEGRRYELERTTQHPYFLLLRKLSQCKRLILSISWILHDVEETQHVFMCCGGYVRTEDTGHRARQRPKCQKINDAGIPSLGQPVRSRAQSEIQLPSKPQAAVKKASGRLCPSNEVVVGLELGSEQILLLWGT